VLRGEGRRRVAGGVVVIMGWLSKGSTESFSRSDVLVADDNEV
jgi:hypothetical protein